MRGQVLQADAEGGGLILGSDGNRYGFMRADWKGPSAPLVGAEVDFVAGDGTAGDIFPLPGRAAVPGTGAPLTPGIQPNEGNSVLLGSIGILCLLLGFVVPVLPTIVAFILGLIGADSAKRYGNGTGLVLSRVAWIGALVMMLVGIVLVVLAMTFAWPMLDFIIQNVLEAIREASSGTVAML